MTKAELCEQKIARRLREFYSEWEMPTERLQTIVAVSMMAYHEGAIDALEAIQVRREEQRREAAKREPFAEDIQ